MRRYRVYIQAENVVGLGPQPVQPYVFDSADEGMSCLIPGSPFWSHSRISELSGVHV